MTRILLSSTVSVYLGSLAKQKTYPYRAVFFGATAKVSITHLQPDLPTVQAFVLRVKNCHPVRQFLSASVGPLLSEE